MMYRILVPLFAVVLFFLEPTFSLFSPIYVKGEFYVLVPHFFIVYLVFLASYSTRKEAILYGVVFGLLYDMYHIDIIGVYTLIYPLVAWIASSIVRHIHRHFVIVLVTAIVLVTFAEILSYGFAYAASFTTISIQPFLLNRLLPTTIANTIFILLFGWLFRYIIVERKLALDARL